MIVPIDAQQSNIDLMLLNQEGSQQFSSIGLAMHQLLLKTDINLSLDEQTLILKTNSPYVCSSHVSCGF